MKTVRFLLILFFFLPLRAFASNTSDLIDRYFEITHRLEYESKKDYFGNPKLKRRVWQYYEERFEELKKQIKHPDNSFDQMVKELAQARANICRAEADNIFEMDGYKQKITNEKIRLALGIVEAHQDLLYLYSEKDDGR